MLRRSAVGVKAFAPGHNSRRGRARARFLANPRDVLGASLRPFFEAAPWRKPLHFRAQFGAVLHDSHGLGGATRNPAQRFALRGFARICGGLQMVGETFEQWISGAGASYEPLERKKVERVESRPRRANFFEWETQPYIAALLRDPSPLCFLRSPL